MAVIKIVFALAVVLVFTFVVWASIAHSHGFKHKRWF